jgi:hypothetical protein
MVFMLIFCLSELSMSGWKVQNFWGAYSNLLSHESIVFLAAQRMGGVSGAALSALKDGVAEPDGDPPTYVIGRWPDWAHYGGSTMPYQWDFVKEQRGLHRAFAASYGLLPDGGYSCLFEEGTNFHSAQDFYTHTSYIYLVDPSNPVLANLEGPTAPPGLTGWGPGDDPSVNRGDIMTELSLRATIREWETFEDLFYSPPYNPDGNATVRLNNMGISSQIRSYTPFPYGSVYPLVEFRKPTEGFVKGAPNMIRWCHTAIPHDLPITIELLKDSAFEGYIFKSTEQNPLLLDSSEYPWDFYHLTDQNGQPKVTVANNDYPWYRIRFSVQGTSYTTTSNLFYIQVPVQGAPSNLYAGPNGWATISLGWQDGSNNETGFDVLRKVEGDENYTVLKSVGPNVRLTLDTTAAVDVNYHYLIRAKFADGSYAHSNAAVGRAFGNAPGAPQELVADSYANRILLTWLDNANNEQGFIIERKEEYDPDFTERARIAKNSQWFEDKLVNPGTKYYYRVKSYNPTGTGSTEVVEIIFE